VVGQFPVLSTSLKPFKRLSLASSRLKMPGSCCANGDMLVPTSHAALAKGKASPGILSFSVFAESRKNSDDSAVGNDRRQDGRRSVRSDREAARDRPEQKRRHSRGTLSLLQPFPSMTNERTVVQNPYVATCDLATALLASKGDEEARSSVPSVVVRSARSHPGGCCA